MMACAAFAASGGPATDMGFLAILQSNYLPDDVARVYRLSLAISWGGVLVLFAVSPLLFASAGIPSVIALCGLTLVVTGGWDLVKVHRAKSILLENAPERRDSTK
jgi:hypothetical protein